MLSPADRREYIVSRLTGKTYNVVPDEELANSVRVIDALEGCGLRLSLLPCVLNLELVLRGSRLCYLLSANTVEQGIEMYKRLRNLFEELHSIVSGTRYLFFLKSRLADVTLTITREIQGEKLLAKLLDYGYVGDDFGESSSRCIVDFEINNGEQLYAFIVPLAKWDESILVAEREKARVMTECVAILGFAIRVRTRDIQA